MKHKEILGAFVLTGALLGSYYWVTTSNRQDVSFSAKELSIRSIAPGDEADYDVVLKLKQTKKSEPEKILLALHGTLSQFQNKANDPVTEWKSIAELILDGKVMPDKVYAPLLTKQTVTHLKGNETEHFLGENFPKEFLRLHIGLLDRFFIKAPLAETGTVRQDEVEDGNTYTADYSFVKKDDVTEVVKNWISYANPKIGVDSKFHGITYFYDTNGRLLAAQGQVKLNYSVPQTDSVVVESAVRALGTHPVIASKPSIDKSMLPAFDAKRMADADTQLVAQRGISFEEAMKKVASITDSMDGGVYYGIFQALKNQVRANPQYADQVAKKILASETRDPSTRRQLSAMFGALAESRSPEVADKLAELAKQCPDNYCKVQAIMGVNTHEQPSATNAKSMVELANTSADIEVAATAIIAAGAIGFKQNASLPELPKDIIAYYNDPTKANIKTSTLAAMGNHGNAEYWPSLVGALKAPDSATRSASVYSMRNIPLDAVNETLVSTIEKDESGSVVLEALKATGFRRLTNSQYLRIAQKSATLTNQELQEKAAQIMVGAYRAYPDAVEEALLVFKEKASFPNVKLYIDAQMKPVEP